jgi:hypothetical protein
MIQTVPRRSQEPEQSALAAPAIPAEIPAVVTDIIVGLNGDKGLPRRALRGAVENWEQVLPVFLDMLECYVEDPDSNDAVAEPLFFILHLFGQMRETRAYPLLMRFAAMPPDDVERVIGDGITVTFSRVAASVFDGNPQPMRDVILNDRANEFIRSGLLEALALATRDGRVDRQSTEAFLRQCYAELKPEQDSYVWVGWQSAISYLGLNDLADLVRRAFASGKIDSSIMSVQDFEEDLAATRLDPAGAGRGHDEIGYFGDAIAELSHWHAFSEAAQRPHPKSVDHAGASHLPVVARPVQQRGRPRGNDPCPCGSGKKYKKCCRGK